jgi:hypothetical protein
MISGKKLNLNYDRQSVGQSVLESGFASGTHDQILGLCLKIAGFLLWEALSDERMGL